MSDTKDDDNHKAPEAQPTDRITDQQVEETLSAIFGTGLQKKSPAYLAQLRRTLSEKTNEELASWQKLDNAFLAREIGKTRAKKKTAGQGGEDPAKNGHER